MRSHLVGRFGLFGKVLAWTVPAAAAAAVAYEQSYRFNDENYGGDGIFFVRYGQQLLSSHWDRAFSNPEIQVGPLQLAFFGSLAHKEETIAIVLGAATALLVVGAARAAGVRNAALLGGAGVMAVVIGVTRVGYSWGHPADAMLPLIWVIAADQARRGHRWRAGLLVGLSAGIETWGILGVAMFAFAPRRRDAAVSTLLAAATSLALFLPFMLGGHFEMLSLRWKVDTPSLMSLLVPAGTHYGWPLRVVQAAVAVSAGIAVVRVLRHSPHAIWAAPLAIVAARLLLDPLLYSYYLAAPKGLILVGAAVGASRWPRLRSTRRASPNRVGSFPSSTTLSSGRFASTSVNSWPVPASSRAAHPSGDLLPKAEGAVSRALGSAVTREPYGQGSEVAAVSFTTWPPGPTTCAQWPPETAEMQ